LYERREHDCPLKKRCPKDAVLPAIIGHRLRLSRAYGPNFICR
jgi:hypothetical protein